MVIKQDKDYRNSIVLTCIIIIIVMMGIYIAGYLYCWEWAFMLYISVMSVILWVIMFAHIYIEFKTLIMDPTGLTVKFLFFEKKYRWDEFKIKEIIGGEKEDYNPERKRCVVFSRKNNIGFSSVFVTFRWKYPRKIKTWGWYSTYLPDVPLYGVDEESFMAKMHEWNVKIDVSMDTESFNAHAAEPVITPELLESERKASEAMQNYIQQENEKLRSFIQSYNKCRVYKIQEMMKYGHETSVVVYRGEESMVVRCVYEKNRRGEMNKTFYIENEKYERLEEIGDVLDNYCDEEGFLTVGVVDSSLLDCHVRRQNQSWKWTRYM